MDYYQRKKNAIDYILKLRKKGLDKKTIALNVLLDYALPEKFTLDIIDKTEAGAYEEKETQGALN